MLSDFPLYRQVASKGVSSAQLSEGPHVHKLEPDDLYGQEKTQ
jgi:hypothetical protein